MRRVLHLPERWKLLQGNRIPERVTTLQTPRPPSSACPQRVPALVRCTQFRLESTHDVSES